MSQEIRAVSEDERVIAALGDLLAAIPDTTGETINEELLAREIEEGFRGRPPLSDTIIEDRREGP